MIFIAVLIGSLVIMEGAIIMSTNDKNEGVGRPYIPTYAAFRLQSGKGNMRMVKNPEGIQDCDSFTP